MIGAVREFPAQPTNPCFGCGGANAIGLKLAFQADTESRVVSGRFKIGKDFQGGGNFLHGGIIATVLDEAMGKLAKLSDVRAVTAELTIEYLKPIRVDQEIIVEASESKREGRNLFQHGSIRDEAGQILAQGRGRFVVIDPARYVRQAYGKES